MTGTTLVVYDIADKMKISAFCKSKRDTIQGKTKRPPGEFKTISSVPIYYDRHTSIQIVEVDEEDFSMIDYDDLE